MFSKVNLNQAYQQLPFNVELKKLVAVPIHEAPIWDLFSTWYLPESNGQHVAGDPWHNHLLGQHLSGSCVGGGTPSEVGDGVRAAGEGRLACSGE